MSMNFSEKAGILKTAIILAISTIVSPAWADATTNKIKHIVVLYMENHSFDNLYGTWEGVNGRVGTYIPQVSQSGQNYACLLQNQPGITSPPLPITCVDSTSVPGLTINSAFTNAAFDIAKYIPQSGTYNCPGGSAGQGGYPGGCTEDLVHRYYQQIYQDDNGKMDRFVTGADSIGLVSGYYETKTLPIYQYLHQAGHPNYTVADHFFHAAFGGSFLNHQWLVSATTPVFAGAVNDGSSLDLHSVLDVNGFPNSSYSLYKTPATYKLNDAQLTQSCTPPASRSGTLQSGFVCGDYAINTIQPFNQPYAPGTVDAKRLPPLTNPSIGDRLIKKGVTWAWYSGGWSNANGSIGAPGWSNGTGPNCADPSSLQGATFPNCPDSLFQFHHQPFNYFATFDPSTKLGASLRNKFLRDEQEFINLAQSSKSTCKLRQVSFVKPLGEGNEHPGYASEMLGSQHLVSLISAVMDGACKKDTMIVVTYDEYGGQFDHVSPPGLGGVAGPSDVWGPAERVPSLVVSNVLPSSYAVDSTQYDTTSILATIEAKFGLQPLSTRDAAVNTLFNAFYAPAYTGP
jgi:acid phosphatase